MFLNDQSKTCHNKGEKMNYSARPKGQYLLCIKDLYEGADPNSELWNKKGEKYKVIGETEDDYIILDSDKSNDIHHIPKGDFFEGYFVLNGEYCNDVGIGPNLRPKATTSIVDENGSILNKDGGILDENGEIDENTFSRVREGGFTIEDIYLSGNRKPHKVKRLFSDYAMEEVGCLYNYNNIEEVIAVCEGIPECIQYLVDNGLIEIRYKDSDDVSTKGLFEPFTYKLFLETEEMMLDFADWLKQYKEFPQR